MIFNDFVNFFNGTHWEAINPNFIVSNDPLYDFMVSKGIYEAYFMVDPTESEMVKFWYNSSRKNEHPHKTGFLTLQPRLLSYRNDLSQIQVINMPLAVVGLPVNNSLIYPDIYGQGINLSFSYNPSALKQHLTIQNNDTLPAPLQYIIDGGNVTLDVEFEIILSDFLEVYINNEEWDGKKEKRVERGNIELRLENETVFTFKTVFAYDSNKSAVFGDFNIKSSGNFQKTRKITLTMKIPYDFLLKENLEYPIFIDPTITVLRPSGKYVEGFPNQNPPSESDIDYYAVDGVDGSSGWLLNGSSPYLDAIDNPANLTYTSSQASISYNFSIANSTFPDGASLLTVRLQIYCKGDGGDYFQLEVYNGASWDNRGNFIPTVPYGYEYEDVDDFLDSQAKIDNAKIRFTYYKSGASNDLFIDYARLMVSWSIIPEHWQLVNEVTPDNDTRCIWTSEDDAMVYSELYEIPDFSLPIGNNISQIEVFNDVRAWYYVEDFQPRIWEYIRTHDVNYPSPIGQRIGNTEYENRTYVWLVNPNTNEEWNESEIDDLRIGIRGASAFVPSWASPFGIAFYNWVRCTQVFIEITHAPPVITKIPVLFIGLLFFIFLVFMGFYLGLKRKQ